MPLTAAQLTFFWEDRNAGMNVPNATRQPLRDEGLDSPSDLLDVTKDGLDEIAKNFRQNGTVLGVMSKMRIEHAADCFRYYQLCGREITAANIRWPTIKQFSEQWKALSDKKERDKPDVPKVTKELPILQWMETFADYLKQCIGVRNVPLYYVIRPDVARPNPLPDLAVNGNVRLPHSETWLRDVLLDQMGPQPAPMMIIPF